jgi:hypothetical protein
MNASPVKGLDEAGRRSRGGPAPVHLWNPPFCGDLDLRIARDGTWHYMGSPIGRRQLVELFASVLRRDEDGRHYLVTPVEKVGITVEDAPFLAVGLAVEGSGRDQRLVFRTNVGEEVAAGPANPLRIVVEGEHEQLKPYLLVRGRLEALVSRAVTFDLVDLACEEEGEGGSSLGLWSGGVFFALPGGGERGGR